jgi:Sulfotransferase domain
VGCRLPNLLVAGVPKAGTTSLFYYLGQHPDICASRAKGIRYFKPLAQQGGSLPDQEAYGRFFSHCRGERYRMEATPGYSFGGPKMLRAIQTTLDDPRIVISLREPVQRLWSAYTFQRTKANLPGVNSFEEYLGACERQRARGEPIVVGGHFNGVSISMYADYLESWFATFGDAVKIVFAEQMFSDPPGVVTDLCRFLQIDGSVADSFAYAVRNKTAHAKNLSVSHKAHGLKKTTDKLLQRAPGLKESLRSAYERFNTTTQAPEQLLPDTRLKLERGFSESNAAVADILLSRGYRSLPEWLQSARSKA